MLSVILKVLENVMQVKRTPPELCKVQSIDSVEYMAYCLQFYYLLK